MKRPGIGLNSKKMRSIFQKTLKKKREILKKGKKGHNIYKFGENCTKYEKILKKGNNRTQ